MNQPITSMRVAQGVPRSKGRVRSLVAIVLVAVSGCATRGPAVPAAPFSEVTYHPYGVSGTATVSGNSFLITRGGDVKRGAGRPVLLIPDTDFLRYRLDGRVYDHPTYNRLTFSDEPKENIDKAWAYTKSTVADVDGKFVFQKLPAGKYVIETQLFWEYVNCSFLVCRNSEAGSILLIFP